MEELLRNIIYQCVMLTFIGGSIWFGWFYNNKLDVADRLAIAWYLFDGLIHSTLSGAFLYLSIGGSVENSTSIVSHIWKDYGTADRRYLVANPTIVSIVIPMVFVGTLLDISLMYSIVNDKFYRHHLQISLCVLELFGDWMTFATELISGEGNISSDSFIYFWCNLVFFNTIWVIVPVALLVQSWRAIRTLHVPRGESGDAIPPQKLYNMRHKKQS